MPPHTGAMTSRGQTERLPLLHPSKKTQVDAGSQLNLLPIPPRRLTVRSQSSALKSTGIDPYTGTYYNSGHCDVCGSRELSTDTLLQQGSIFPALTPSPPPLHSISSTSSSLPSPSTAAPVSLRRPRTRPTQSTQRAPHHATHYVAAPSPTLAAPSTAPAGGTPTLAIASHAGATAAPRGPATENGTRLRSSSSSRGLVPQAIPLSARRHASTSQGTRTHVRAGTGTGASSSAGVGIGTGTGTCAARVRKGEVYRGGLAPAVLLEQRYLLADAEKHRIATFIAQAAQLSPLVHCTTAPLNTLAPAAAEAVPVASGGDAAAVCVHAPHAALPPPYVMEAEQAQMHAQGASMGAQSSITRACMSEALDAHPGEAAAACESVDYSHTLPPLPSPTSFSTAYASSSSSYTNPTPRTPTQRATHSAAPSAESTPAPLPSPTPTPMHPGNSLAIPAASSTPAPATATPSTASTTLPLSPAVPVRRPSPQPHPAQPHPALATTARRPHTSATLGSLSYAAVTRTHTSARARTSPSARTTISRLSTMRTPCSLTVVSVRRPKRPTPPLYAAARPPCTGASARVSRAWAGVHALLHEEDEDDEDDNREKDEERGGVAAPEYGCARACDGAMQNRGDVPLTMAGAPGIEVASLALQLPLPLPSLSPEQLSVADSNADTTRPSTRATVPLVPTSSVASAPPLPVAQTAGAGVRASALELHAVDTGLFVGHAVKLHPLKQRIYASVPYLLQRALARRATAEVVMARIRSPTSSYNRVRVRGHRPISHAEPFEALAYNAPPPALPVAPVSDLNSHRSAAKLAREQRRLLRAERAMGRATARGKDGKRAKGTGAGNGHGASGGTGAVKAGSASKCSPRPHTSTSTSSSVSSMHKNVRIHPSASSAPAPTSAAVSASTSVRAAVRDPWQQTAKRLRDSLYSGDYRMSARLERLARPPQALALIRLVGSDLNLPYHMLKQAEEHTELGDFTASATAASGRSGLYGIEDVTADVIHRFGGHGRPQTVLANTGISESLEMRPSTESHFNHLQCGTARTQPIIRANLIANKPVMSAAMALQNTLCTCPPPADDCLPGPCACGSLQGACVEALLSARSLDEVDESVGLYHSFL